MQKSPTNKRPLTLIILFLLGLCSAFISSHRDNVGFQPSTQGASQDSTSLVIFKNAFEKQQSNIQVRHTGRIAKILREDDHGLKHQHFVVTLNSGQKILIANNIDLASKVEGLKEGENYFFFWRV